jgi:hypothetical protein
MSNSAVHLKGDARGFLVLPGMVFDVGARGVAGDGDDDDGGDGDGDDDDDGDCDCGVDVDVDVDVGAGAEGSLMPFKPCTLDDV